MDQYFIQSESKHELKVGFVLKRIPSNIIINSYFPSFCIMVMTIVPIFLKEEIHFGTAITLVLTAFLCLFSLFQTSLDGVPKTAYLKLIDYWNILALIVPLLNFFIILSLEIFKNAAINRKRMKNLRKTAKFFTTVLTTIGVLTYLIVISCI